MIVSHLLTAFGLCVCEQFADWEERNLRKIDRRRNLLVLPCLGDGVIDMTLSFGVTVKLKVSRSNDCDHFSNFII